MTALPLPTKDYANLERIMAKWIIARTESMDSFWECAGIMDKVSRATCHVRATGAGVSIGGGIITLIAGAACSATGGVTTLTGALIKAGWSKSKQKEAVAVLKIDEQLMVEYKAAHTEANKKFRTAVSVWNKNWQSAVASGSGAALTGYSAFVSAPNNMRLAANGMALLKDGTIPAVLATDVSKQLVYPSKNLLVTSTEVASTVTKTLTVGLSLVSVGFGIWEIASADSECRNGCEIANKMRETYIKLRKNFYDIKSHHEKIMAGINM